MSLTTRVLIALAAGLAVGLLAAETRWPALAAAARAIEPLGTLFISAIRMTVIPLVVGSLIAGVASARDAREVGRMGRRALALFVLLLTAAALASVLIAPPLLARLPLDASTSEALRASALAGSGTAGEGVKAIPSLADWLVALIPVNPVKAAADGAILPLIVFSLLFALAAARLAEERRAAIVSFFGAVADASLVLARWILVMAPIGVFALAMPLALRLGVSALGALAGYVALVVGITCAFVLLVLYPAAAVAGRVPLVAFARAALPAQAVAFSSRSSVAALPAMIESARDRLGLSETTTSFLLPLAMSTFRVGAAIGQSVGALFIARLYGIDLDAAQLAAIVATTVLTSFSVPGIPSGSIIMIVPVLAAAGVPAEGIGILIGVDLIPDMFRTTSNVTADLVVATMLGRRGEAEATHAAARPSAAGASG